MIDNNNTVDMTKKIIPQENYEITKKDIGYTDRKHSTPATYERIGFKSGLEVHQQLKTKHKLFCNCPAGKYNDNDHIDAEVIRHMRPTLSELGEYDRTALMEFKTRKTIIYKLNNDTTCTYEVDDTPPFIIDKEALDIAIEIALLSKMNIVGELHITRKQYLDGSIPTGFQRTAIVGIEGEIPLSHKTVKLIQLSVEEDSCREISDIGHVRVYKTDRLGMPLIETVTAPELLTPDELKEACQYIRFLNRSTGKVRTGIGAGREDVNVSCKGGTRIEIKGVAHTRLIPELSHNECFRQWALLNIKNILNKRTSKSGWAISHIFVDPKNIHFTNVNIDKATDTGKKIVAVNLPFFKGILSHFTQPGKCFVNELSDRLKVIACLEKPNMMTSEDLVAQEEDAVLENIATMLHASGDDAQIIFWADDDDIKTALETIEERCRMAFDGVPPETRKYLIDGTTIFERVLPGADRMYPDTDSAPLPIEDDDIEKISAGLPKHNVAQRTAQLVKWDVPEDTFTYIHRNNIYPIIENISTQQGYNPKFAACMFAHRLKFIEGHYKRGKGFTYNRVYDMLQYLQQQGIDKEYAYKMLPEVYSNPNEDFSSIIKRLGYVKTEQKTIIATMEGLRTKSKTSCKSHNEVAQTRWLMGQLKTTALGNINMEELYKMVKKH